MRLVCLVAFAVSCVACAGDSGRRAEPPTRHGELPAAWEAYQAYCEMCPRSTACCLGEADFAEPRWSEAAGPYLRALREHYECRRGDTLVDYERSEDARTSSRSGDKGVPVPPGLRWSCEQYACMASAGVMASQLDRALVTPIPHAQGAIVACR